MTQEIANVKTGKLSPTNTMKRLVCNTQVAEMFQNALGKNSGAFLSSLIDLYADPAGTLKDCEANEVLMEALKAATLKLPINKNLGFAYIVPYKKKGVPHPQFQMGYKGYIQLAMRSGQYQTINANVLYDGQKVTENYLTGEIKLEGEPVSDNIIGYFAYFRLINGFEKAVYWDKSQVTIHANKFSKSYDKKSREFYKSSAWESDFDAMAMKTVLKHLLSKYGVLSVDMQNALMDETDSELSSQIESEANAIDASQIIESDQEPEAVPASKQKAKESAEQSGFLGPDFQPLDSKDFEF